jgi:uncharacterized membrane protein YdjX (TVP38/TMEM64 family)
MTIGIASAVVPAILGFVLIGYAVTSQDAIQGWVDTSQLAAPLLIAIAFGLATGSALLPTYALSFACGVYYGPVVGSGIALAGVNIGAIVGYGWGRLLGHGPVMRVIESRPKAAIIRRALVDRGIAQETIAVTLIRLPPNSPFAITNLLMAAVGVRPAPYLVGTAIGISFRTVFAVILGVQVESLSEMKSAGGGTVKILGIVVGVAVFITLYKVLGKWAQEALKEHFVEDQPKADPTPLDTD